MTEISTFSKPLPSREAFSSKAALASGDGVLSSDFETFLRMLTTQMQNQDPLNPVDATDYATQLATFSSVEQQVLTNDLLAQLSTQLVGSAFQQMASWVGMEALSRAPVEFGGTAIEIRPDVASSADSARIVVRNESGDEIYSQQLDIMDPFYSWDGATNSGDPAPSGIYNFEIESYDDGELLATHTALAYNRIVEVRGESGFVYLTLSDGSLIEASTVTGLRNPSDG
ncbi:flagellar hook capping FlgD N-terminal domain-containing protein [Salipiger sp.]|uniref:flagellar hook capping FlgD N-terminal domain-containing protein n=1 Tax=Salipiger sp. TaxID=2078585 RepID=UPI003A9724D4